MHTDQRKNIVFYIAKHLPNETFSISQTLSLCLTFRSSVTTGRCTSGITPWEKRHPQQQQHPSFHPRRYTYIKHLLSQANPNSLRPLCHRNKKNGICNTVGKWSENCRLLYSPIFSPFTNFSYNYTECVKCIQLYSITWPLCSLVIAEVRSDLADLKEPGLSSSVSQGSVSSSSDKSSIDGTSIAISIIVTFALTAAAVGFLAVIIGLILHTHFSNKRKEQKKKPNYWSSN